MCYYFAMQHLSYPNPWHVFIQRKNLSNKKFGVVSYVLVGRSGGVLPSWLNSLIDRVSTRFAEYANSNPANSTLCWQRSVRKILHHAKIHTNADVNIIGVERSISGGDHIHIFVFTDLKNKATSDKLLQAA
jgi:hypothetical protein